MAIRPALSQDRAALSQDRTAADARTVSTFIRLPLEASFAGLTTIPVLHFDPRRAVNYDGSNVVTDQLDLVAQYRANQGVASKKPTFLINGFGTNKPALSFDSAASQVLTFNTNAPLVGVKNFTMTVVVKASSLAGSRQFFNIGQTAFGPGFAINTNGTGKREIFSKSIGVSEWGDATTDAEIWTLTVDNSAILHTYLNGVEIVNTVPATIIGTSLQGGCFGARFTVSYFSGLLGHALVWNALLSGADIITQANELKAIYSIA